MNKLSFIRKVVVMLRAYSEYCKMQGLRFRGDFNGDLSGSNQRPLRRLR
jgi:hypothetical protein